MKSKLSLALMFLVLFLSFIYVRPYDFIPVLEPLKLTRVFIILALIFSLFERLRARFIWKEKSFLYFFLLQILCFGLLPFSLWKGMSLEYWLDSYLKIFVAFYLIILVANNIKRIDLLINVIGISCGIVAVRLIMAYRAGSVTVLDGFQRVVGVATMTSDDPNDVALVMGMALPIVICLILNHRKALNKLFYVVLAALIVISIIYTGSRGGYMGTLVGIFVFVMMLYKKRKMKFLLVATSVSILLILFIPQEHKTRFLSVFDTQDYSYVDEQYGRVAIWKRGMEALKARPWGVGIKNYALAEGEQKSEQGLTGRWMVAHNTYLEIGVELGVLGLWLYIMFLLSAFANIRKTFSIADRIKDRKVAVYSDALAGSLASFMVSSFFLSQAYNWNQYVLIAIIAALKNIAAAEYQEFQSNKNDK
ncbi:MAG TPA: O-antigen ligase family protein [Candidatus Omnitrophota bacterium]|nr:O-antigen ligase family protein [Candidatus Omnitrophota bacterium]HPD85182.1 O-antigen ligase family protein [Candidatus Omnitrophota bacterium]HRZ04317.1 O-antigen ligase family protein [Candidatus Omnitrophota bacterium]